jgi:ABC-type uncharacterized transport system permease subunit
MIDDSLLLDLLIFAIFLIIGIRAGVIFFRYRTKYNLAALIIIMIFLVVSVLDLFLPGSSIVTRLLDNLGFGMAIRILLVVIVSASLLAFLFYPDIKRFLIRRKMKNK